MGLFAPQHVDLPRPGIELVSPAIARQILNHSTTREACFVIIYLASDKQVSLPRYILNYNASFDKLSNFLPRGKEGRTCESEVGLLDAGATHPQPLQFSHRGLG